MSTDDKEKNSQSEAADEVRRAFAALPFEQQISTLLRIELDMVGDAVDTVVSAASRAANDIADAFNRACTSPADTPAASETSAP
jgi:hypothetical protein